MKTLIVEDDSTSVNFLAAALEMHGKVDVAENGIMALGMFMINRYDLVCLDMNMPGISGHEVLKHIRAYETVCGIPLGKGAKVFITSSVQDSPTVFSAFRESCDEYLPKPLDLNKLMEYLVKYNLIEG